MNYYDTLLSELAYESCGCGIGLVDLKVVLSKKIGFNPTDQQWEVILFQPLTQSIELYEFYKAKSPYHSVNLIQDFRLNEDITIRLKKKHHLYFLGYRDTSIFLSNISYEILANIAHEREYGIAQYDLLKRVAVDNRNITYYVKKLTELGLIRKHPILKNSWKLVLSVFSLDSQKSHEGEDELLVEKYEQQFKEILEQHRGKNVPQSVIRKALGLSGSNNKKKFKSVGRFISRKNIGVCIQARIKDKGKKVTTFWTLKTDNPPIDQSQIGWSQIAGTTASQFCDMSQMSVLSQSTFTANDEHLSVDENDLNIEQNEPIDLEGEDETTEYLSKEKPLFKELYELIKNSPNGATIRDISSNLKMSIKLATRVTQFVANTNMFNIHVGMEGKLRSKTSEYRLRILTEETNKDSNTFGNNFENENSLVWNPNTKDKVGKKSTTTLNRSRSLIINEILNREGIVGLSEIRRELSEKENTVEHHKTILRLLQPGITKGTLELKTIKIPFDNGGFRTVKVVMLSSLDNKQIRLKEYIRKCSKNKPSGKKDSKFVVEIDPETVTDGDKKSDIPVKKYWHGVIKPIMIRTRTCFEELWEFARISDHLHSPKSRDNKMESEKSVSGEEILKQESVEMSDDFTEEESTETKSKHFFKPIINEYSNVEECLQQREENEHGVKIRLMEFINQLPTNMFHKLIGIVKTSCPFGKDIVYSTTPIKDLPPTERNWILSNKSWIKRFNVIVGVLRNLRLLHRDLDSEHADGMILSTHGIFYVQKTDLSIIKEIRFALKSKKVIDSYFDSLQSASFQLNDYEGYTVIINGLQETGYIIKPMAWQNKAVTLTKPQRAMIYDHIYNEETVFDKQKLSEETGFSNAQVELVIRQYTQRCEKKSAVMDKRLKIRKFTPRGKKDVPKVWETADDKKIIKAYKNYWYNVNDTTDSIPDSLPAHILKRLAKSCNVRVKQVADRLKSLVKSEDVFGVIDDSNMSDYDDERDDQDDQIEQIEQTVNERTETIDYDQSVIKKNDVSMTFETPEERDEIYKCLAMLRLTPEEIRDKKIDVIELFNIHEDSLQLLLDKKCVCKDKNPFNPMTLTLSQRYFSLLESKIFNNNFFEKRPIFPPNGIIVSVPPYDINQIHTTSIILLQEMKDVKLFIFPNMENEQNMPNSSLVLYKIDVDGLFVYEKGTHWYTDLDYLTTSPSFSMQQINLINEIKFVFDEFDRASQPLTIIGILNRFETQPDSLDYVLSYLLFINVISRFSQVEMPMEQDNFNQEPPQTDHITPWTTYSGDVNIEIYQTLLHRLKCFIFKYPSISVENLCKKFPFAHEDTMILLQQLVNEEIVEIRENGLFGDGFYVFPKCSSLFS